MNPCALCRWIAFDRHLHLRHAARPVEVQIRIEVLAAELIEDSGMRRGDVAIADVLANHQPFFDSAGPLSLEWRGRDLICSTSSLFNKFATV